MLKNCKSNIGKEVVEEYYKTEYGLLLAEMLSIK